MKNEQNNYQQKVGINKKKRKTRKIFMSVLMIVFVGLILTASTYAWFTSNKKVTVNQIDVNVTASNGLQVSVDARTWKTIITNTDITGAVATYPTAVNQLPSLTNSMSPVSTAGGVDATTGFLKMFKGEIGSDSEGQLTVSATQSTEVSGTSGNFVAFDLFFQVTSNTPIYLTSDSNVVALNTSTGIENAARVAFLQQGAVQTAGTDPAVIQALKAADGTTLKLWEPNYDVHTAAAIANANSNYGQTTTAAGATRLSYYGIKADIPSASNILLNSQDTQYFTAMTPTITSVAAGIPTNAYATAFTLLPGITKYRVYMWVEGQDVDCENNASGGSLSYNLQFSSLSQAP